MKKLLGKIGVDSGQILVCDPCYLSDWKDGEVDFEKKEPQNHYDEACKITTKEGDDKQGGEILISGVAGTGVVACSGLGDGEYEVWGYYTKLGDWGERIAKIEISFL